jgi:hypothetical protein
MEHLLIALFNSTALDSTYVPVKMKSEHFKVHKDGENTVNIEITEEYY